MSSKAAQQQQPIAAPKDKWLIRTMKFTLIDGRIVEGRLVRYDGHANFILLEVTETRYYKDTDETVSRPMGTISVPKRLIAAAHVLTEEEEARRDAALQQAQ